MNAIAMSTTSDYDTDGLPDGFERIAGTSLNLPDSDNDGQDDVLELPMIGIPVTDPCNSAPGTCGAPPENIFANGFEG